MAVTLTQAKPIVETLLNSGIVPFLKGSPAIGKSSLAKQIAKEYNLELIDLRLAECDPTDLNA